MTNREVIYVNRDGETDQARYDRFPDASILAAEKAADDVLAIVKVLDRYELLDLSTIQNTGRIWTVGVPLVAFDDLDAAIAYAVLVAGRY